MEFYTTFTSQVELLPRITIVYGEAFHEGLISNGIAIEWLWFGMYIKF